MKHYDTVSAILIVSLECMCVLCVYVHFYLYFLSMFEQDTLSVSQDHPAKSIISGRFDLDGPNR